MMIAIFVFICICVATIILSGLVCTKNDYEKEKEDNERLEWIKNNRNR